MEVRVSTARSSWEAVAANTAAIDVDLSAGDVVTARFKGFGCCFNELGWSALAALPGSARETVLSTLFSDDHLGFAYCRVAIGANDYSDSWYSHAEVDGDFDLAHFSISRDLKAVIPYIRAAMTARGGKISLFASPWSPPAWMKTHKTFNYGTLVWDERYLKAYAQYFVKFVQAYEHEGLPVAAVHVQNEPDSDQKFPSCVWTGETLAIFIRDYLRPAFDAAGLNTEIWLGTIERPSFNDWVAPSLLDPLVRKQIAGVGFQWAGKGAVARTRQAAPDLPIIQTENECGDGENTWDYAHYVFDLAQHYLSHGAQAYVYWNAVLFQGGISTWGWKQNSMFCVDAQSASLIENPEFQVMRHFARYVRPGAQVLTCRGSLAANAVMFRNTDQSEVAVIQNPLQRALNVNVALAGESVTVYLPAKSFATVFHP